MTFQTTETVWKLRAGVVMPFAPQDLSVSEAAAPKSVPSPAQAPQSSAVPPVPSGSATLQAAPSQRGAEGLSAATENRSAVSAARVTVKSAASATLPLRKEADLYLAPEIKVDFLYSLISFLISRGLTVGRFDSAHAFKPGDVVLLAAGQQAPEGTHAHTVGEKRPLWEFLKREFAEAVKA